MCERNYKLSKPLEFFTSIGMFLFFTLAIFGGILENYFYLILYFLFSMIFYVLNGIATSYYSVYENIKDGNLKIVKK